VFVQRRSDKIRLGLVVHGLFLARSVGRRNAAVWLLVPSFNDLHRRLDQLGRKLNRFRESVERSHLPPKPPPAQK